ncbi:MAG TPA: acyl-ACP--UDP-N-acetylglucosamine O-acyltransferase [Chthoniobacterales bacterium]|jgi:UDP-N-acetylglucosamine acyltransferase
MIHPTACIDPTAQIADNVQIGAFCVIGAGVEIGEFCVLHPHVVVHSGVKMGRANTVHAGAVLGDVPQDLAFVASTLSYVVIGDRNVIRENVTIHRASRENGTTRLGDDCFLMANAHLGHDVVVGDRVILANNVLLGGHVTVGDRVFFGGSSAVHQHVRIGRLAIAQGLAGCSKDVPPFTMVAEINLMSGLNTVGMKRAGFSPSVRAEIKSAFALIYRSGLNISQALAEAEKQTWGAEATEFFDFILGESKHGICAFPAGR